MHTPSIGVRLAAGAAVAVALAGCSRSGQSDGQSDGASALAGTCVECHEGITSPHDKFAIACVDCHGGDATVDVLGVIPDVVALMRDPSSGIRLGTAEAGAHPQSGQFQLLLRLAHVTPATEASAAIFYANGIDDDDDGLVDETGEFAVFDNNAADGFTIDANSTVGDIIDSEYSQDLNYVRFINPGDLRVARASCGDLGPASEFTGQCHDTIVQSVRRSLMATLAGVQDGAFYGNNLLPGNRAGLAEPKADNITNDPRAGRFGFLHDYEEIDFTSPGFDRAANRFLPNALEVTDTTPAAANAVVAKVFNEPGKDANLALDEVLAGTTPVRTVDLGEGAFGTNRFLGFGGKNLVHPQRALRSMRAPPVRNIAVDTTNPVGVTVPAGQALVSQLALTAASLSTDPGTIASAGFDALDSVGAGFRFASNLMLPGHQRNFFLKKFAAGDDDKTFLAQNNAFLRMRSSGCSACHVLYVDPVTLKNTGQNLEPTDPTVRFNGKQPDLSLPHGLQDEQRGYPTLHKITTRIPTEQCAICHTFVTRIDLSYEGRWELHGGLEFDPFRVNGLSDAQLADPANRTDVHTVTFTQPAAGSDPGAASGPAAGTVVNVQQNLAQVRANDVANNDFTITNDGEFVTEDTNNNGFLDAGEDRDGDSVLDVPDRVERSVAGDGRQNRIVYGGHNGAVRLNDVHQEVGMTCIDCHFLQDSHGDGNIYARNWDLLEIECDDCHGTPGALATLVTSGPTGGNDLTQAVDEDGKPFFEIAGSGDRIQRSRVVPGLEWRIPQVMEAITPGGPHFNPRAQAAMGLTAASGPFTGQNAHIAERGEGGRLECYSCHNAFTPNCMACHYEMDTSRNQVGIWLDREQRVGFSQFQLFGFTRSPFLLGANGLTEGRATAPLPTLSAADPTVQVRDAELGKLATFRSLMEVHVSVADLDGEALIQNVTFTSGSFGERTSSVAMNMFMPHTVRLNETKDCESCHTLEDSSGNVLNNHLFAGTTTRGTGRYSFLGDWFFVATDGASGFEMVDSKLEKAGKERAIWPGFILSDGVTTIPAGFAPGAAPRQTTFGGVGPINDAALVRNFTPPGEIGRGIDIVAVTGGTDFSIIDVTNRHALGAAGFVSRLRTDPDASLPTVTVTVGAAANALAHTSPDISDPFFYVAAGSDGLAIVDASNYLSTNPPDLDGSPDLPPTNNAPPDPTVVLETWTGADARDLEVRGSLVFVADGANGVTVVDVRNPANPAFIVTASSTAPVLALTVMDRFVFGACGAGGVQVFDWADATTLALDPASLRRVAVFDIPAVTDDVRDLKLQGNLLVVAGGANGVHFLDATRPQALAMHSSARFNGSAQGTISLVNEDAGEPIDARSVTLGCVPLANFVVVADANDGGRLVVIDITDPLDWRERLTATAVDVEGTVYAGFDDDPNYRFSLERRDPMTPRKPTRTLNPTATTGMLVFPVSGTPIKVASGSEWDRIAAENGRRLRESWQEGAGVLSQDIADRMRAVRVREVGAGAGAVDVSGNGLRELEEVP